LAERDTSSGLPGLAALAAVAAAGFAWLGRDLPVLPTPTPDSDSYLQFSPVRPHGYSWFLAAYRLVSQDWTYLPAVQLGLSAAGVFLLAVAIWRRSGSLALGIAALLVIAAAADIDEFPYLMSDPIYAASLTAGIACFVLYAAAPRPALLLLAGTGFGIAVTFRAVGLALLPGFLVAVAAERSGRGGRMLPALALAILPVVLLVCAAGASQFAHHDRFALGSWGGMSVLGKLPLLSHPVTDDARLGRLNGIVESMAPVRQKLRQLDPLTRSLVTRQYHEYLRWYLLVPELDASWTEWHAADSHRQGRLASELAQAYIAKDPLGYAWLTATDLAGLWAMPRWLGSEERAAAIAELERAGELPLLGDFLRTEQAEDEFYRIVPEPTGPVRLAIFRTTVVAFWVLSLGLAGFIATRPAAAARLVPDLLLIVVAVHAVYLGTALMEGAHERYIMPTWPALVAGPILALGLLWRGRGGAGSSLSGSSG
jgi:hypothetical protein